MANTEIYSGWTQKHCYNGNLTTGEIARTHLNTHCKCMKMEITWLAFLMYKYPCVCLSKELKITIKNNVKQKLIQYRSF